MTTSAFKKMGYKTPSPVSGYDLSVIKSSINNGRPVLIGGYDTRTHYIRTYYFLWWVVRTEEWDSYSGGHEWIIDDYSTRTRSLYFAGFTLRYPVEYVHCNIGWGGQKDGWYLSGSFDVNNGPQTRSVGTDNFYQFELEILPNVYY
jgi:hypothetical protein